IKIATISDPRAKAPQGNIEFCRDFGEDRAKRCSAVRVLMRVKVGRIFAGQVAERGQLPGCFTGGRFPVVLRYDLVEWHPLALPTGPFPQVEVQSEAEAGVLAGIAGCLRGSWPANHEARGGNNPPAVRFDDTAVHTRGSAEIVGVNDDIPLLSIV